MVANLARGETRAVVANLAGVANIAVGEGRAVVANLARVANRRHDTAWNIQLVNKLEGVKVVIVWMIDRVGIAWKTIPCKIHPYMQGCNYMDYSKLCPPCHCPCYYSLHI